ncbi:MAG: hypothetical protein SFW64_04400 [Alphaproteobacteria bacterium]|nr:hypothetical protein [Alphaproteobacteria bacterium]
MVQVKFDRTDHNEDSRALFNATSAAIEAQGGGYFVNAYDLSATIIPAGTSAPERAGAENGGYERITGDGDAVRQAAVINPETGLPAASSAPLKGLYPEGEAPAVKEAGVADKAADTRTRVAASPYASMYDHQPQVKMTTEQVGAFQDAILAQGGRLADAMKAHGGRDSKPGKAFFAALAETVGKENATSIDFTNSGEFAKLLAKAGSAKSQASVAGVEAPASAAALAASLPPSFDGALAGRPAGLVIPGQAAGAAPTSSGAANVLFSGFGFSPAEAGAPKANEVESVVAWSDVYRLRTAPTPDNLPAALAKNSPVPSGEQVAYLSSAPEYLNAAKPAELDYSSLAGVSPLKVPDARTAEQRSSQASAGRHT